MNQAPVVALVSRSSGNGYCAQHFSGMKKIYLSTLIMVTSGSIFLAVEVWQIFSKCPIFLHVQHRVSLAGHVA